MSLFFKKSCIGIDVGTSSIKLVQLSLKGNRFKVDNYAIAENKSIFNTSDSGAKNLNLKLLDQSVVDLVRETLKRAKMISVKKAIVSIPAYLAFVTVIEMPVMSEEELADAIEFEARQYIPIPIKEVMLDWQRIPAPIVEVPKQPAKEEKKEAVVMPKGIEEKTKIVKQEEKKEEAAPKQEVLLVAVPKYLVEKYKELVIKSGLVLKNIELENFSLIRSILGNDKSNVVIVDFGAQSTDINLVSEGILREVRTLDVNGNQMTKTLSRSLNISAERAESLKKERGLSKIGGEEEFSKVILPTIDAVVEEIKRMERNFLLKKNKKIERVILTGGTANLPGLVDYLNTKLEMEVGIGNPFKRTIYPQELNRAMMEISPVVSIATGLAMRGLKD